MPQVFYNTSLPEVHEGSAKEHDSSLQIIKPGLRWPLMVMALIIAAAIAVGVGVGVWRHREHVSHESSTFVRCGARTDLVSSWLTIIAHRRRQILTSHVLHSISSMIHLWQLCLSPMAIGIYISRIILVSSDVWLVLQQMANGTRAQK